MALHAVSLNEPVVLKSVQRTMLLDETKRTTLVPLRHLLRASRISGRVDSYCVCAAVGCGIALQREILATTLMQLLRDTWGQAPVVFHPTVHVASFDEAWLLSLITAMRDDDTDSAAFLLGSRLPKYTHRMVLSLLAQLGF
ncbi:hypothetical protein [Cognatishimia sp. MH4019]|uniref:hypothetical protein n=1 Tax=Cognatishimia sp. MH4019 TaxID=2854030 RepID=UPI001CD77AB0|nr:hypothetical protein [Cognatishimia sp. MH4019]